MSFADLTRDERIALAALAAQRGGPIPEPVLPVDAAVFVELAERGLTWRSPAGGWWLTADGQTMVESWA